MSREKGLPPAARPVWPCGPTLQPLARRKVPLKGPSRRMEHAQPRPTGLVGSGRGNTAGSPPTPPRWRTPRAFQDAHEAAISPGGAVPPM